MKLQFYGYKPGFLCRKEKVHKIHTITLVNFALERRKEISYNVVTKVTKVLLCVSLK